MLRTFSNKKNLLSSIVSIIIILFCVVGVYFPLTKTFYQQDEWLGFGTYLASGLGYVFQNTSNFFGILWGEGRIFSTILYYLSFKFLPFNIIPIAIFALVSHFINAVLLFFLIKKVIGKVLPSLLGSLFFVLNSVSQSAVTWAGAVGGTLPSTTLILLSLFLYFNYIDTNKTKWLVRSFFLIYLSLFFKETGVFLFLFLPFISILFKKYSIKIFFKTYWYYLLSALIIVIIRIIEFKSVPHDQSLFLTGAAKFYYSSFITRAMLYPMTSFSLSIIPPTFLLNFAKYITNVYYPFFPPEQFVLIAQTVVMDLVSIIFSGVIFVTFLYLLKVTDVKRKKIIVFWLTFIITSFLPYIIVSKSYAYLDSRYYYLSSVGWAVIFAWVLTLFLYKIKLKLIKLLVLIIFIIFLYIHAKSVVLDINQLVKKSQERIHLLEQITSLKPKLEGNKNLFYFTGNEDYLLPGHKVPFQQGFGYTLMSIYYKTGNIPKKLLEDGYLFELGSEGYDEVDDVGFGYYSNLNKLKESVVSNKLNKNSIIGLYYDSKTEEIIDITEKTVVELFDD